MLSEMSPNQLLATFVLIGLALGTIVTFAVLLITRQQGTTATKIAIEVAAAVRQDTAQLDVWEKAITQTVPKESLAQIVSLTTAAISLIAGSAAQVRERGLLTIHRLDEPTHERTQLNRVFALEVAPEVATHPQEQEVPGRPLGRWLTTSSGESIERLEVKGEARLHLRERLVAPPVREQCEGFIGSGSFFRRGK